MILEGPDAALQLHVVEERHGDILDVPGDVDDLEIAIRVLE